MRVQFLLHTYDINNIFKRFVIYLDTKMKKKVGWFYKRSDAISEVQYLNSKYPKRKHIFRKEVRKAETYSKFLNKVQKYKETYYFIYRIK